MADDKRTTDNKRTQIEKRIEAAAARLNDEVDRMAERVRRDEEWLEVNGAGVVAEVNCGDTGLVLIYRRIGQRFRIGLRDGTTERAWVETTRQNKLLSYGYVDDLLEQIATKLEQSVNKGGREHD